MTVSDEDGGRGRGIAPQPGNPAGGENAKPAGSDTTQPADGSVKPAEGSSDTPGAAETAGTDMKEKTYPLAKSPAVPSELTLTRSVVPVCRSRTKTSG